MMGRVVSALTCVACLFVTSCVTLAQTAVESSNPPKLVDAAGKKLLKLEEVGTTSYVLTHTDERCPSISTILVEFQDKPWDKWSIDDDSKKLLQQKLDAIKVGRREFIGDLVDLNPEQLFLQKNTVRKYLEGKRKADDELCDMLDEVLSPERARGLFSKLTQSFETGLLASKYFCTYVKSSKEEMARRQSAFDELWLVHLEYVATGKNKDAEQPMKAIRSFYKEIEANEFLTMKQMVGRARPTDTVSTFLSALPKSESDILLSLMPSLNSKR